MWKNEYKPPRVRSGELKTPITFYEYGPDKDSPFPDEKKQTKVYECWGKVDRVWMRDLEQAKQNNTTSDVTLTIRDPLQDFVPNNKHFVKINTYDYENLVYNITTSQPDLQSRGFITIVASLKEDESWL